MATDEIAAAFEGAHTDYNAFYHGHTYTGNSLACAAALATLKLFDENRTLDNVRETSAVLTQRLAELKEHPYVGEIRHKGVMVGIELVADRETRTAFPAELRLGHQVTLAARKNGVIVRPLGDVVILMPAPGMPAELVEQLCDTVFAAIDEAIQMQVA